MYIWLGPFVALELKKPIGGSNLQRRRSVAGSVCGANSLSRLVSGAVDSPRWVVRRVRECFAKRMRASCSRPLGIVPVEVSCFESSPLV